MRVDSGISYDSNSNDLRIKGDVVAFVSDDRLKTNRNTIANALEKVRSLNGFTFNFNERALDEFGKDTTIDHVGVSAQEVEKVLPEAVTDSAHDSYLTVKYEKIVPLLIEAIKEQSDQIDSLREEIKKLK
jgi:hypothetical protein